MSAIKACAVVFSLMLVGTAAPQSAGEMLLRMPWIPDSNLIRRVEPEYPAVAVERRIQGAVRFTATIGTDGHVEQLKLVSGPPLLTGAAREAVEQWTYRPTLLAGKPVKVMGGIMVYFRLDQDGNPVRPGSRRQRASLSPSLGSQRRGALVLPSQRLRT